MIFAILNGICFADVVGITWYKEQVHVFIGGASSSASGGGGELKRNKDEDISSFFLCILCLVSFSLIMFAVSRALFLFSW